METSWSQDNQVANQKQSQSESGYAQDVPQQKIGDGNYTRSQVAIPNPNQNMEESDALEQIAEIEYKVLQNYFKRILGFINLILLLALIFIRNAQIVFEWISYYRWKIKRSICRIQSQEKSELEKLQKIKIEEERLRKQMQAERQQDDGDSSSNFFKENQQQNKEQQNQQGQKQKNRQHPKKQQQSDYKSNSVVSIEMDANQKFIQPQKPQDNRLKNCMPIVVGQQALENIGQQ